MTQETPPSPQTPADASSATTDIARRDSQQLRRSTLGVLGIAFLVISAAAPLTAMAGGAPVAMLLGNGPGIPAAYVVVSVILLIFSVGYTAMARHHTSTGAFYSFVASGAATAFRRCCRHDRVVAAIAGIIAAVSLRSRSPELYAQMGRHRDNELLPGA